MNAMDGETKTVKQQVKSFIAKHDFKAARRLLERYLDQKNDESDIWELYANILKKLGKITKARDALFRRDEIKRESYVFRISNDDLIEDVDIEYIQEQAIEKSAETYVYGEEYDLSFRHKCSQNVAENKSQSIKAQSTSWVPANELIGYVETNPGMAQLPGTVAVDTCRNLTEISPHGPTNTPKFSKLQDELPNVNPQPHTIKIDEDLLLDVCSDFLQHGSDEPQLSILEDIDNLEPTFDLNDYLKNIDDIEHQVEFDIYAFDPDECFASEIAFEDILPDRITQKERASYLAAEFIHQNDWSEDALDLLSSIFNIKKYGSAYKALSKYAEDGVNFSDLRMAAKLKEFWAEMPKYWLVFYSNGDTNAAYYNLSWALALRFVSLLQHRIELDCDDVLLEHLDISYEHWFTYKRHRCSHSSFANYLNYLTKLNAQRAWDFELGCGFGLFSDAKEHNLSDSGDYDVFGLELETKLSDYGYSLDRKPYEPRRFIENIEFDADYFYAEKNQPQPAKGK